MDDASVLPSFAAVAICHVAVECLCPAFNRAFSLSYEGARNGLWHGRTPSDGSVRLDMMMVAMVLVLVLDIMKRYTARQAACRATSPPLVTAPPAIYADFALRHALLPVSLLLLALTTLASCVDRG